MYKDKLPINNGKRVLNDDFVNEQFRKIAIEIGSEKEEIDLSFLLEGFCGDNLEDVDISGLSLKNFRRLMFDTDTVFPSTQIEGIEINEFTKNLIEQGKSFSNVKEQNSLHEKGIDGTGTTIVLLDRYFDSSIKEFENRVVKHVVLEKGENGEATAKVAFDRDNNEINDTRNYFKEKYGDNSHGNTTACLAVGSECGVAPKAEMYIFSVGDVTWSEAQETMLKHIKQEIEKENMKIPDVISMSADIETSIEASEILNELHNSGCFSFESKNFWKDFLFGRISEDGKTVKLDELMETVKENYEQYDEKGKARKIIDKMDESVVLPCTERTCVHCGKDGKPIYKYYGSLCGSSHAIPQIAGLCLLAKQKARQLDQSISYEDFIGIVKNKNRLNSEKRMYVDAKESVNEIDIKEILKKIPIPDFSKEDSSEVVVLKFIEYIKDIERKRGLTDEQITAKYVHGCCEELATETVSVLKAMNREGYKNKTKKCKMPLLDNLSSGPHYVVELYPKGYYIEKDTNTVEISKSSGLSERRFYDITGGHDGIWFAKDMPEKFYIENEHYIHTKRQMSEFQLNKMIPRYAFIHISKLLEQEKYVPDSKTSFDKLLEELDALDKQNISADDYSISSDIEKSMINNASTELGQDVESTSRIQKNNIEELQNKEKIVKKNEQNDDNDER